MKKLYPQKSFPTFVLLFILSIFAIHVKAQEQYFLDETEHRLAYAHALCVSADVADIDGDGDYDILATDIPVFPPYSPPILYINDGQGYFSQENYSRLPDTVAQWDGVGFGDIDNDNDYDVYLVSEHHQDLLYVNNGLGFFTDETSLRLPPLVCSNSDFVFADFSGDNFWDLIIICQYQSGLNQYLLNDQYGYYTDVTDNRMPLDTLANGFGLTADIDNDLDLDLLINWWDGNDLHITGLLNQGGYFANFEEGRIEDYQTRWMDAADVDNDNDLDIVISKITGIGILINHDGQLINESDARIPYIDPARGVNMISLGDYDNDGDIDIFGGCTYNLRPHFLINDGSGHFLVADYRVPEIPSVIYWPEPLDADNDGDLDIYLGTNSRQRILINHSTPDTIPPVMLAEDLPIGDVDSLAEYQVKISAYDNISVEKGALAVNIFYRIDGSDFITDTLVHCGGTIFNCFIPGQESGTVIDYYIKVEDKMGNYITSPANAPDSLHHFEVYPPSQIHENDNSKNFFTFEIYPNPSNSEFSVNYFADENLKLNIYDLSGRKLHTESLPFNASNTRQRWYWQGWSELASGIYFIELNKTNRKEVRKAVLIR